jgi:hypothetical protein
MLLCSSGRAANGGYADSVAAGEFDERGALRAPSGGLFGGSARDQPRNVSNQLDTKTLRERGREFLHPGHFHV